MRRILLTLGMLLCALACMHTGLAGPAYATDGTDGDWSYTKLDDGTASVAYTGAAATVAVPSEVAGLKVTGVQGGFENVQHVTVPEGVTFIDDYAFCECANLQSVMLPKTLKRIGESAFAGCSLMQLTLPAGVTTIADYSFSGCSAMTDLTFESSKVTIGAEFPNYTVYAGTRIHAKCGTSAQQFANRYGYAFTSTGHVPSQWTLKKRASARSKTNGQYVRTCTECGEVVQTKTIAYPKAVTLSSSAFTYNGKAHRPSVTVKDAAGKNVSASGYTVEFPADCKSVGYHELAVSFKGDYLGTLYATFSVTPKGTAVKKLARARKGFTATWGKQAAQADGYQVRYSLKKNMASAKTKTVAGANKIKASVKGLKAKKTYYVQVRTYKSVTTPLGKKVKVCSGWSKAKKVKTR